MTRQIDNYDLSAHNTFGLKAVCASFIEYDDVADLVAMDFGKMTSPVMHIGGGSNLLFTGDFPGTVLHSAIRYINTLEEQGDDVLLEVGAGVSFDQFVDWTCRASLWGAENLSAIPGEVGASAVQNIGAYGVEVKDIIERVNCFDTVSSCFVSFGARECRYGYRDSIFKHPGVKGRYIVTSVLFRLSRKVSLKLEYGGLRRAFEDTDSLGPSDIRNAVMRIRAEKLPDPSEIGSAGSFFKNPVVDKEFFTIIAAQYPDVPHYFQTDGVKIPAAWMIERCGLKGACAGGAAVYEKQPLVIVNAGGKAVAEDILALENRIISAVKERFGVTLHPEVEHIQS